MTKARMFFGIVLAAALVSGCALTSAATGPAPNGAAIVQLDATKALATAHLAYNTLAQAALTGIQSGVITGAAKAKVKELDNDIYGTLQKADAATDMAQKAALAAQAMGLIGQMQAALPASLIPK